MAMVSPSSLKVKLPKTGFSLNFSQLMYYSDLILTIAFILDLKKETLGTFLPSLSIEQIIPEIETSSIMECKCITLIYPVERIDLCSGRFKRVISASIS